MQIPPHPNVGPRHSTYRSRPALLGISLVVLPSCRAYRDREPSSGRVEKAALFVYSVAAGPRHHSLSSQSQGLSQKWCLTATGIPVR
jgi:hypothetical protein